MWEEAKKEANDDMNTLRSKVSATIKTLKSEYSQTKSKNFLFYFNASKKSKETEAVIEVHEKEAGDVEIVEIPPIEEVLGKESPEQEKIEENKPGPSAVKPSPAQDKINDQVDNFTKKIETHKAAIESGIVPDREETEKKIKSLTKTRDEALKRKSELQNEAQRKREARRRKKQKIEQLIDKRP